ncbi:MAG: gliding motility-associated C-terminal domain-containing protein [Cyclobacteriaceae bacterium]
MEQIKAVSTLSIAYCPRWLSGSIRFCLLLTAYFLFPFQTTAQIITKAEYFFDTDPENGNGTPITITPSGTVTFTTSIPTSSLSQGFHFLGIRVKETGGVWSIFESRGFYITASTSNVPNIAAAEYFLDSDPGNGNGTAIPISSGANLNFVVSVPTTSLASGFHFLAIRTKDLSGKWGVFEARGFYITTSTTNVPNITSAEYFFDADPGNGNGTPIPVTAGATTNFTVSLPATGLQPGFHFLAVRTKGADGKWGIFESRGFYVTGSATDVSNITKAEYFFDTDPGNGNGISIPITSGATSNFTAIIPTTGLTPGFHFLAIRTKGSDGKWGIFESRGFYVSPIIVTTGDIVAAEYFIDTDPGEDNGIAAIVNPTGPTINQIFSLAINSTPSGAHKLGFRVKDAKGIWSAVETADFNVLVCTPPFAPTAPSVSRCNSGTVTLVATAGVSGSQVYRWYADATSTTVLFTGASFTTPSISISTNFFVSVFDPNTLCESNRTSVTAGVISTSPPILNVTGSVTICQGNAITLIAPAGFSNYLWSTGETTQTISVNTSGNFTAQVGNGTCTSVPSAAANIVVAPRPSKPTIIVTGSPLCAGQSITLKGPNGFTYLWSNGATTQQISPTLASSYTITVTDVNGCTSLASDAVVISSPPTKPSAFIVGGTTICQGQSSTLIGPTGFASYAWSTGAITQQLTASAAGNYTVRVTDAGGCVSPLSDPITIAINPAPAKPIITVAGSTTLCTGQSVSLNGPAGFNYVWSTGATTQQISVSQTGSYSLVVRDALGCTSALSDPMVVTVNPCGTSTRPPAIQQKTFTVPINNSITVNIRDLLTDPDNDLNLTTLKIFESPSSGAKVSIDANATLTIDYKGVSFGSAELFTLEVCDQANNCTRQQFTIIVAGEVIVYNAISPNGDPLNEALYLEYITDLDATKNNVVSIFNRWGDKVFEAEDYNNTTIAFKGIGTNGETLPTGTYFYQIEFKGGVPVKTGFFSLRR